MHDAGASSAMRRGTSQPPPRGAGADVPAGANPTVLWIKGFDGLRTQTYLCRESNNFFVAFGVESWVIFGLESAAEVALDKYRALDNKGDLRLVPDKEKTSGDAG